MFKNGSIILAIIFIIGLTACIKPGEFPNPEQKEEAKKIVVDREKERINEAKNLVNDFIFVKNNESNLCFAYKEQIVFNSTGSRNMPIVVQVPCENVEKLLK